MHRLKRYRPISFILDVADNFFRCGASESAAALAYFLTLTIFPLLLCLNYLVGFFSLDLHLLLSRLHQFFPSEVLAIMGDYLNYAADSHSIPLLIASLFALVLSASAGLRAIFACLDRLYQQGNAHGIGRIISSVVLSLLCLLTIYLSAVVLVTGDWFFSFLEIQLPDLFPNQHPIWGLSALWGRVRYLVLFAFALLLILAIYRTGIPRDVASRRLLGSTALCTALVLVVGSLVFSWFIGLSARYSLIYGSLASLIVLSVWLYFCGTVLLLGAVVCRTIGSSTKNTHIQ